MEHSSSLIKVNNLFLMPKSLLLGIYSCQSLDTGFFCSFWQLAGQQGWWSSERSSRVLWGRQWQTCEKKGKKGIKALNLLGQFPETGRRETWKSNTCDYIMIHSTVCVYVCVNECVCVTSHGVPVARQNRFIHHRDQKRTSGVKDSGEELEVSRVVSSLLAGYGRHRHTGGAQNKTKRKVVSRGGAVPGLVTGSKQRGPASFWSGRTSNTMVTGIQEVTWPRRAIGFVRLTHILAVEETRAQISLYSFVLHTFIHSYPQMNNNTQNELPLPPFTLPSFQLCV